MGIASSLPQDRDIEGKIGRILEGKGYSLHRKINRSSPICFSGKLMRYGLNYWVKIYKYNEDCLIERYAPDKLDKKKELESKLFIMDQCREKDNISAQYKRNYLGISEIIENEAKKLTLYQIYFKENSPFINIEEKIFDPDFYAIITDFQLTATLYDILKCPANSNGINDPNKIEETLTALLTILYQLAPIPIYHKNLTPNSIFVSTKEVPIKLTPPGFDMRYDGSQYLPVEYIKPIEMKYQENYVLKSGEKLYDKYCDVYSFGMIAADIIFGIDNNKLHTAPITSKEQIKVKVTPQGTVNIDTKITNYSDMIFNCINSNRSKRLTFEQLLSKDDTNKQ